MHVTRVGFAPVKGTRHASYDEVVLDARGPVGDRRFCLVDVPRRRVLRTVQHPALVAVRSAWDGSVLTLALPSGRTASAAPVPTGERVVCDYWGRPVELSLLEGPHAALAAAYLGLDPGEIRLASAPPAEIVYGAPVSVVSLSSLRSLASGVSGPGTAEGLAAEAARFRATVVVDGAEPWSEEGWVGRTLHLGAASVRVRSLVPRCAVIDLDPTTGVPTAPLLKALAARADAPSPDLPFGVDAEVVEPGVVRPGDAVQVEHRLRGQATPFGA